MSIVEKHPEIKNWKLREVIEHVKIVHEDSVKFIYEAIPKLGFPLSDAYVGIIRGETHIGWDKMPEHYKFFFDRIGWEERIKKSLEESELRNTNKLILTYGWQEPAVMIPTHLFFEDWEGFTRSMLWDGLVLSEDFKLIIEVTRDYFLHSNFIIMPEK